MCVVGTRSKERTCERRIFCGLHLRGHWHGVTWRDAQEEQVARDLLLDLLLTLSLGDSSRLSLRLLERKKPD